MLRFIEKAPSRTWASGKPYACGLFECPYCHKRFIAAMSHGKRDHSCGCAKNERIAAARTEHGAAPRESHTPLYTKWGSMKAPCNNPGKKNYGGKGIKVCPEWAENFAAFETWSMANGYQEHLEIDRKKAHLGYSQDNCRWVTRTVNNRTTSRVKLTIEIARRIREIAARGAKAKTELGKELGVSYCTIQRVLNNESWQEGKEKRRHSVTTPQSKPRSTRARKTASATVPKKASAKPKAAKKPATKKQPGKIGKTGPQTEAKKILAKTNPVGRPSKFTDDVKSKILMALRAGNYIETAAAFAGVDKVTIHDWLRQGAAQEKGEFREFSHSVNEAIAYAEVNSLQRIGKAGEKDWKAEAWRLERRFQTRWGRTEAKTVTVETGEGDKKTKVTISDLYKELQGEE